MNMSRTRSRRFTTHYTPDSPVSIDAGTTRMSVCLLVLDLTMCFATEAARAERYETVIIYIPALTADRL